jgi:hypothetical protein
MAAIKRRHAGWLLALAVAAAVDLAVTIHATVTYAPKPGQPSVATAGQLLGWLTSALLVTALILTAIGVRRAVRHPDRRPPRRPPNVRPTGFREP